MFEKISDSLLEFSYQKMRKRVNKCPRCQEMLEMPLHLPEAKYESTISCSHCGWLGTLSDLGSHLLNRNVEIEEPLIVKPKQSQIREVLGDQKASWLIPAKKKINFLMVFGGIWTAFTSLFIVLMLTQNVQTSGGNSGLWFAGLMLTLFFTIGLVIGYIGMRMSYTELLIRVDDEFVTLTRKFFNRMWDKRILRDKVKDVRLGEAYRQNEKPVYQVEIVDSDGAKHQFGSHLEHEEKRWLLTQIKSFLQVGDVAWRDAHGESEKKVTIDKLPIHSEISSQSLKIQKVGNEGFRITRTYSMAPWLFFIGIAFSLGSSIWIFYEVGNFHWGDSNGWLEIVDLIFLILPIEFYNCSKPLRLLKHHRIL